MIIFSKITLVTKPHPSHHQCDGRIHRMNTTKKQMGYQTHNTHQSHKKEKLREPEASHVIHIKPCEMWIASLTKSIETWLKSAGHKGGMSLNKDPDL